MRLLISFIGLLMMTACGNHYYYYPTFQDVPSNSKRHQLTAKNFVAGYNEGYAFNYAPTDHIGANVNINKIDDSGSEGAAQLLDFGLYAYNAHSLSQEEHIYINYSVKGAFSYGLDTRYKEHFRINLNRYYLQPGFSLNSRFLDFGFSTRLSYLKYGLQINDYAETMAPYNAYNLYELGSRPFYFIEPHAYIGIGYKGIKLNYHIAESIHLGEGKLAYREGTESYLSLSLRVDIEKIFNQIKSWEDKRQ